MSLGIMPVPVCKGGFADSHGTGHLSQSSLRRTLNESYIIKRFPYYRKNYYLFSLILFPFDPFVVVGKKMVEYSKVYPILRCLEKENGRISNVFNKFSRLVLAVATREATLFAARSQIT